MKLSKTQWITFGALAAISVIAGGIYMAQQVKKALQYSYKFSRMKINKIGLDLVQFDVYFNLNNPSKLHYTINSIDTTLKIGDQIVAKFINKEKQPIAASVTTEIFVKAELDPKKLAEATGQKWTTILTNIEKIGNTPVIMEMNFNIGYLGNLLNVNVPYTYSFPLKDILPRKLK